LVALCLMGLACSWRASAQATKAQLEISETFFTITTALNSCGYDAGLADSLPVRQSVRAELQSALKQSPEAADAQSAVCNYWREHDRGNPADISPFVSLALQLGPPPLMAPTLPDSDMPPDAAYVVGISAPIRKFYSAAGIHALWERHQKEYQELVERYHDPISAMLTQTDLYLKMPFANLPGQRFRVYLEPMLAPGQVQARNYGAEYSVVISPARQGKLRLEEIRHTYLHFILDPLAASHGTTMKRLEPILVELNRAPLARSFREDIALLVNECLIRAIEIRTSVPRNNPKLADSYVNRAVAQGFVLTRYFYDAMEKFEETPGMKSSYGDLLHGIDVDRERKRAREIAFAEHAEPEVVSASRLQPPQDDQLNLAEQKFASGDRAGAQQIAEAVLRNNTGGDQPGRAAFLLARIASLQGKMEEARIDFEQAVKSARDPRTLAWSHIYLGRIYDIQDKRDVAMEHYRAALAAGDPNPDTRAAAENGIAGAYQKPGAPKQ
jgi:tetratricopeptide (TPR) repeat protein